MLSSYSYTNQKLSVAVYLLAIGAHDVRNRLINAFQEFHTLREKDFPDTLKEEWNWIMQELTRFGPIYNHRGEVAIGSVENTMRHIRTSTGVKIAKKLCDLESKIKYHIK